MLIRLDRSPLDPERILDADQYAHLVKIAQENLFLAVMDLGQKDPHKAVLIRQPVAKVQTDGANLSKSTVTITFEVEQVPDDQVKKALATGIVVVPAQP